MTRTHDEMLSALDEDPVAGVRALHVQLSGIMAALRAAAKTLVTAPEGPREPIVDLLDQRDRVALELGLAVSRCIRLGLGLELPGVEATTVPEAGPEAVPKAVPKAVPEAVREAAEPPVEAPARNEAPPAVAATPPVEAPHILPPPPAVAAPATEDAPPLDVRGNVASAPSTHRASDGLDDVPTTDPPPPPTPKPPAQPPSADALAQLQERFRNGGASYGSAEPCAVVRAVRPCHPFAEALGAPHRIVDPAKAIQALQHGLHGIDGWLSLPRPTQRKLLTYAAFRARSIQAHVQARAELGGHEDALARAFQRMSAWSKEHEPGFVHGLRRTDTPRRDSWHSDSLRAWDALGLSEPELRATRAPHGLDLDTLRTAASRTDEHEQVRDLVAMALPHHDLHTLAEIFVGWEDRLRGNGRLKPLRKQIRALRTASDVSELNPEIQLSKIEACIDEGQPIETLRTLIVDSLPVLPSADIRLIKLVADHPAALDGEPKLRGLRRSVRRHKKRLKRAAKQSLAALPEGYPDDDWEHFGVTQGATAVVVGGDSRQRAQDRLKVAFRFAEVDWIEPSDVRKIKSLAQRVSERNVGVVILLRNYRTHTCDDLLIPALKASDTPWVSVDHGYGVTQVRASMERFWAR